MNNSTNTNTLNAFTKSSVRPQDDLFRAVNGEWLNNTEIPEDKPRWGSFDALHENSLAAVRELLEDDVYANRLLLSRALYQSFMDEDAIEKAGINPIAPLISEVLAIKTWEGFAKWVFKVRDTLSVLPFSANVSNDLDHPDIYALHIGQAGIFLPDESYYRKEDKRSVREVYNTKLQNLLDLFAVDGKNVANSIKLDEFCARIAKYHWDVAKNRDVDATHNPMPLSQVQELMPNFAFSEYFNLSPTATADVAQTDFLQAMNDFWVESELDNWKNWAVVKIITSYAAYLAQNILDANFAISQIFSGVDKMPQRWKRGVSLVDNTVGDEVGQVYVDIYYNQHARQKMSDLVDNLLKAYEQSIKNCTWLTNETREKALVKLGKFTPYIGFPEHWHDYTGLKLSENIIDNVNAIRKFENQKWLKKVGGKVDKLEWHMTPQTVNAYYNPPDNVIVFPAAILQPPFFDVDRDDVMNYGGIGAVIGHEIGHGFDDQGSKYDGDGKKNNWWTDEDLAAFEVLTGKLNAQFEKFTPQQLVDTNLTDENLPHVNGGLTTGENVGDVSGLKIALLAYAISQGFNSIDDLISQDKMSVQKFFYAFGEIWRNKGRDEFVKLLLAIDPHSPAEFRANTVRNLDAFHAAFDTSPSDALYLNPADRVDIW